jgi:hypothetical protein
MLAAAVLSVVQLVVAQAVSEILKFRLLPAKLMKAREGTWLTVRFFLRGMSYAVCGEI